MCGTRWGRSGIERGILTRSADALRSYGFEWIPQRLRRNQDDPSNAAGYDRGMSGRSSRVSQLLGAILLPLLVLAWLPSPTQLFRCRMDGTRRTHCCCESKDRSAHPVLRADCCDLERVHGAHDAQSGERAKETTRSLPAVFALVP